MKKKKIISWMNELLNLWTTNKTSWQKKKKIKTRSRPIDKSVKRQTYNPFMSFNRSKLNSIQLSYQLWFFCIISLLWLCFFFFFCSLWRKNKKLLFIDQRTYFSGTNELFLHFLFYVIAADLFHKFGRV